MAGVADIDEDFYSRQLYVLGHDAMQRMATADVLVAGMRGLGVEIAKNVILAGVRSVTVQDEGVTTWSDLSSQFFLSESHLGRNRAECSLQQLVTLNPNVRVEAHSGPLDLELLRKFQVVVLTHSSLDEQKRLGDFCHSNNIKFLVADTRGLCGQLFCDFGEAFEVLDCDGEPPASAMIQSISKAEQGLVVHCNERKQRWTVGSRLCFSEVQGMTELNSIGTMEIKEVHDQYSFSIGDTSQFSEYKRGGQVTEVKASRLLSFKALSEALWEPQLLVKNDYGKIHSHQTLHLAFQALHAFEKEQGRLPAAHSQMDADTLLRMVRELNSVAPLEQLEEAAVLQLSFTCQGELAPINAFMGGVAAQEVIKACSRKFMPLQQWMYFDALECLPKNYLELDESCFSARGCRYDGQIAVFGSDFQEKLQRQRYFLVGAGAIGCELLKNFSLMGLGAGDGGSLTLTDMDFIERSNLNRQFLFRERDIGKAKSEVAAKSARAINPQMNIKAHQNRLDQDSECVYDYDFFMGLDGVAAALDNVEARVYLSSRCVQHQKPMLEGGTLGSRGHSLVVVPNLTESYKSEGSGAGQEIPLCTLKHFPNRIEHTLQWARDHFEGLFTHTPENVNLFLRDADFVERTVANDACGALKVLGEVRSSLLGAAVGGQRPSNWEDCVSWARRHWEALFHNDIRQLLHCFPPEQVTKSGLPFWSGAKRCPQPLTFDPDNETHLGFVLAAANLYAQIYRLEGSRDAAAVRGMLGAVSVPPFMPSSTVRIPANEDEEEAQARDQRHDDDGAQLQELRAELSSPALRGSAPMTTLRFEKDDDSNFHMDYIHAAANLRAENYHISPADRHQSKGIVGRIIPAIATTTAAVSGLMCLELYKLLQDHSIDSYRTTYLELATAHFVLARPSQPKTFYVAGKPYTEWDDFRVEGRCDRQQEMTVAELLQHIKDKYSLTVCSLFYGTAIVFNGQEERLGLRVSDLVKMGTKKDIPPHVKMLELAPSFAEDENSESVPPIRYLLL